MGRHTHEWGRFTIRAQDLMQAGRLAAVLGWWLHCWQFEEADVPDAVVVEHAPPSPFGAWEEFVAAEDLRRARASSGLPDD